MITIASLMQICLEFDQQQLTSRPSPWGVAAERLATVCEHAEPSLRDSKILGDWRGVDLRPVRRPSSRELGHAAGDMLDEVTRLRDERSEAHAALAMAHKAIEECITRPMGTKPESAYEAIAAIEALIGKVGP